MNIWQWLVVAQGLALCILIGVSLRRRFPGEPKSYAAFWQNLDKFIAVFLFLVVMGWAIHMIHHGSDAASLQWIEGLVGQIWSSIAILLGVAKLAQVMQSKPGDSEQGRQ